MARLIIVQTEHLDAQASAWLAERADLIVCAYDDPRFAQVIADADGLVVRTYTQVDARLLSAAPQLKVVGRAGVGLDNIDIAACHSRGIEIVYTPDANTQAVVEFVLALMCDALRPRSTLDRALSTEKWNQVRAETVASRQFNELSLGILGLGRVGSGLAKVAGAIGCRVMYHDLLTIAPEHRFGATPTTADELFSTCDVLSIHIDGRPTNRGFVDESLISLMKENVLLLNTSRGFVVDNLPLARFLREHPNAMACLDVHEPEPFSDDYPLLGLSNVRLYPHLASRTATAMANMSWVVRDVLAVLEGRQPRFPAPPTAPTAPAAPVPRE